MQKFYETPQQSARLLATLVMLLLAPLSMLTFAQSPCSSPVARQTTNAKSTNADVSDDIALMITNLLNDGSQAAWTLEAGATFTENTDGTARIQGTANQSGSYATARRMTVDLTLGGKSFSPDANGAFNPTSVPTTGWYYFTTVAGSLTGLDALAGGQLTVFGQNTRAFQVGMGANQQGTDEDKIANGASGSFAWQVVTQPTNGV